MFWTRPSTQYMERKLVSPFEGNAGWSGSNQTSHDTQINKTSSNNNSHLLPGGRLTAAIVKPTQTLFPINHEKKNLKFLRLHLVYDVVG